MRLRRTDAAGGRGMKIAHTNIEKKESGQQAVPRRGEEKDAKNQFYRWPLTICMLRYDIKHDLRAKNTERRRASHSRSSS